MNIEDRRYPRIALSIPAQIIGGERNEALMTTNVSLNGAFLRTDAPRPLRQLVQIRFALPDREPIEVMAMVTRIISPEESPSECGMGVGFFALSEEAKNAWNAFLRSLSQPKPAQDSTKNDGVLPSGEHEAAETPKETAPIRRKHIRHVACFVVRLKDEARARQFYTENISAGGMFFKTPLLQKQGAEIELVLVHPESHEEFRIRSTVVRVEHAAKATERGMGIQFSQLSKEEEGALKHFIDTGVNHLNQEDNDGEALAQLRKAVELDPNSAHAHTALGKALTEREEYSEAMACFKRATAISPGYLPALLNLKDALLNSERINEAIEIQADIDEAMRNFARTIAQHATSDVLDEAPLLPPDLTLTNSLIFEVLEHKYAHTLDGTTPLPLVPPRLSSANEQPSVLSLIQQQKASHSVDLIPAFAPPPPPDTMTMEDLPASEDNEAPTNGGTGDFHPFNMTQMNDEMDPLAEDDSVMKTFDPVPTPDDDDNEEAILLTSPKASEDGPKTEQLEVVDTSTLENERFIPPAEQEPGEETQAPDATNPMAVLQSISTRFAELGLRWELIAAAIQAQGPKSIDDEAQLECMLGLKRELDLISSSMSRLQTRTQSSRR